MGRFQGKRRRRAGNRNAREASQDAGEDGGAADDGQGGPGIRGDYVVTIIDHGNFRMEAYYAAQGIYNMRWQEQQQQQQQHQRQQENEGDRDVVGMNADVQQNLENNDDAKPAGRVQNDSTSTHSNDSICICGTAKLVPCLTNEEKQQERLLWRMAATKPLPASFRIALDVDKSLREHIQSELDDMLNVIRTEDGSYMIKKLNFLPHAYQLGIDRVTIRKNRRIPQYGKLHQWLGQQTESGFITRQEVVSMIPPVVLAPQPMDLILDMCAAPGSKTSQILERLGTNGGIVANDANPQRAHMLAHQLRRLMDNNPVALITCCDGQLFPGIVQYDRILCDVPCSGDGTSRKNIMVWKNWSQHSAMALHALQIQIAWKGVGQLLKVGGYMCYSTCSLNPIENEAVVAELLRRAEGSLELVEYTLDGFKCRPGMTHWKVFCEDRPSRRVVKDQEKKNNDKMKARRQVWVEKQSTQQNNKDEIQMVAPTDTVVEIENTVTSTEQEGPLAAPTTNDAAPTNNDDESNKQEPPRRFDPTTMDDDVLVHLLKSSGFMEFSKWEDVPGTLTRRVRQSCFPPTSIDKSIQLQLSKCIRCYPHDNDSGGFFVALLRKTASISPTDRRPPGPKVKKPRVEVSTGPDHVNTNPGAGVNETADDDEDDDGINDDLELDDIDEAAFDDDNRPVRGRTKGNLLRNKNGKAPFGDVGKDDFLPLDSNVLEPLISFYGLSMETFQPDQLMTRADGNAKVIYYVGKSVKDLIDAGIQKRVTIVSAGVKAFVRAHQKCEVKYRISQEAAHILIPHMSSRKVFVGMDDFVKCIKGGSTALNTFSDDFQDQIRSLSVGSFIAILKDQSMVAVMWRCLSDKVDGLVSKVEIDAIKTKLKALEGLQKTTEPLAATPTGCRMITE